MVEITWENLPGSLAATDLKARPARCEILVVGGGMGGVAAALAALSQGASVIITEPTLWLGGQMTSQGVSALDEHRWIETFGGTRTYYALRNGIREYYRKNHRLSEKARAAEHLNPGNGWVSRLCFEPRAALAVIAQMLGPYVKQGKLQVFYGTTPLRVERHGRRLTEVAFRQRLTPVQAEALRAGRIPGVDPAGAETSGRPAVPPWLLTAEEAEAAGYTDTEFTVVPEMVIDASELGDLLPLAGLPYRSGAESRAETGEPHAKEKANPNWVQSFTYTFAVEYRPGENHTIPKPEGYEQFRDSQPYTFKLWYGDKVGWKTYRMFEHPPGGPAPFWTYRRLIDRENFEDMPNDIAMINWPGNDYRSGNLIDRTLAEEREVHRQAKNLALGFLYWLQTEAPRDDGGRGYPELLLRADVMGSADGLSQYPYIRESRRIKALKTILEQEIAAAYQPGPRATHYPDTAGIGFYPIDIHPGGEEPNPAAEPTKPFEIPLGALIPADADNLLAAAKNIGTTHITNGAYRLHPVEWNIGETAGYLAAYCLQTETTPAAVRNTPGLLRRFQGVLAQAGIPLFWFIDVPIEHPSFVAIHRLAALGILPGDEAVDPAARELTFQPDQPADLACLDSWLERARRLFPELGLDELAREALARELFPNGKLYKQLLPEELAKPLTRGELAERLYRALLPSLEALETREAGS
ncbi:MAG: FAD-dependent oxidoreductase [Limnochordales bacterium]|nr:FAD-dependent oxidoreductase [Limnochordales bacterium]